MGKKKICSLCRPVSLLLAVIMILGLLPAVPVLAAEGPIDVWTTNSYVNPFQDFTKETTPMAGEDITLLMARNDRESAQILLRHDESFTVRGVTFSSLADVSGHTISADNIKYNFVDYHYMGNSSGQNASTTVRWGTDYYPDRLSNDTTREVAASSTQSLWITVYAPAGTTAGTYTGTATVQTTLGDQTVNITAKVIDVEIPAASNAAYDLAYWQNISGTWNWSGINPDRYIISGIYGIEKWSDDWWNYVESAADTMEEARINVLHVMPLELLIDGGSTVANYDDDGNAVYTFDWSKFDDYVSYFVNRGFIKKLELYHLLNTVYASKTQPTILIPNPGYDATKPAGYNNRALMVEEVSDYFANYSLPADQRDVQPRVKAFYDQYIRALDAHLREKGWLNMAYQHVEDECISTREKQEYLHMAKFFAERTTIPYGDPIDSNNTAFMTQNAPLQFPLSSIFDSNKSQYQSWLEEKPGTVMMYTCLNPQGSALNKFVDKPVWQMRLQTWYSYEVDVTGHLHWAWDAGWSDASQADGTGVDQIKDLNQFKYKGDDFVVWPDVERGIVASSIRAASIRDGAEDYEVFTLLATKGEDYENWIKGMLNGVVQSNYSYTTDIAEMMAVRERIYQVANGEADIYSTVTFDSNHDSQTPSAVRVVTGSALGANMPADPAWSGYLFTGWNTKADGSGDAFTGEVPVNENITVYAQWVSGNDILRFSVNGIRGAIDAENATVQVQLSSSAALTAVTPVVMVSPGASYTPAGAVDFSTSPVNFTVTAQDGTEKTWYVSVLHSDREDYTVTFEENGGSSVSDLTVPAGTYLMEPETPVRDNYIFEGWYTDAALQHLWNFATDTVAANMTLYAKWVDAYYLNNFDDPDNTGNWMSRYGVSITEKGTIINDPDAQDGKAIYFEGLSQNDAKFGRSIVCTDAGTMVNGTIEMRLKVVESPSDSRGPTLGISFRTPATSSGYYAGVIMTGGHSQNQLLTDVVTEKGATWCLPWTDSTFELERDRYYTVKVRFYDQAVTLMVDDQVLVSGDTSWPGWPTEGGYVGIHEWGPNNNVTIDYLKVTPAREPAQYQVRLDKQDGTEPSAVSVTEGTAMQEPAAPSREGYTFQGWYTDPACENPWDFSGKIYADMTLYAKWYAMSSAKEITSFVIQGFEAYAGVIDAVNHTISVQLPAETDLTSYLTPVLQISEKATVQPASGMQQVFAAGEAKIFTVTAEDGSTQDWAVTVTLLPADSYRVSWQTNGGVPAPTQNMVRKDAAIAEPAAMTKDGYAFDGWYLDQDFTEKAVFPIENVTADITLYAKWTGLKQASYVFMSDTHVTSSGDSARLNYAFSYIDTLLPDGYDGLIIAGDLISDGAGDSQMQYVQQILDAYNPTGAVKHVVRGNHDPVSAMETLNKEYYPDDYFHVVIGGYHFLMCDSNNFDAVQQNWLSGELAAIAAGEDYDAGDPIFVVMHAPLSGTVLGSSASFSSSGAVYNILKEYPQVVTLTGHSHRDIYDDRSIFQQDFTSVHLGGMQYIEFDSGRIEGNLPAQTGLLHADGSQSQMNQAVIATVYSDRITFDRYDFSVDRYLGTWEVSLPLTPSTFTYSSDSRDKQPPAFAEDSEIAIQMVSSSEVEFSYPQASDNAYVYDYLVSLKKDGVTVDSLMTFSQFYAAEVPEFKTNSFTGLAPETAYTLEITARDAVGNASTQTLTKSFITTASGVIGSVSCDNPVFDLGDPENVVVNVTSTGVDLLALRFGDTALISGTDYVLQDGKAIIYASYLQQFEAGAEVPLSFVFEQGDPAELKITVTSSAHNVVTEIRDFEDGSLEGIMTYKQNYALSMNTTSPLNGSYSLQITSGTKGKQMLIDTKVPQISNGVVEFDVCPTGADFGAMAFIIRGIDDKNHVAFGCDRAGDWLWINMRDGVETFGLLTTGSVALRVGQTYHIKISFYGDNYEVYVDDTCVIRTVIPGLNQNAGYTGVHNWGTTARGFVVDDVKVMYAAEKTTYQVSWNADGGIPVPDQMTVADGGTVAEPAAMIKDGYIFDGWYLDEKFTQKAAFPIENVTSDLTLYAKWSQAAVPVTGVTLDQETLSLTTGDVGVLKATVAPADASNQAVTWSSSNEAVATVSNGVVTAVAPGTATITVTTADGGKTASCTVTVMAVENPDVPEIVWPSKPSKPSGASNSSNSTAQPGLPFTDVPTGAWYYASVKNAWEKGLIDGMTATAFCPDETLTVAQAIKLAAALHQMDNQGKVTLSNGTADWYSTYVDYAVAHEIIETFYKDYTAAQMNAPVSRSEFVHIFYGAMKSYTAINTVADNAIPDVKTADPYGEEIYTFYRAGIVVGSDAKGTFRPGSSIKRSEVAAILIRMYDTSARENVQF